MLKLDHIQRITEETNDRKRIEKEKQIEEAKRTNVKNLIKKIDNTIISAANRGEYETRIRTDDLTLFNEIREQYKNFNPSDVKEDDDTYIITFKWGK